MSRRSEVVEAAAPASPEACLFRALASIEADDLTAAGALDAIRRAGWALVPREAPRGSEVRDMLAASAIVAAGRGDDVFLTCYSDVIAQAENILSRYAALIARGSVAR
jgi:hypothetical protein